MKLLIIIALVIIFFLIEAFRSKCIQENPSTIPIALLHHAIFTFALLGWILDDPVILFIYICIPLVALLQWRTSDNRCIVTDVMSDICGSPQPFGHIFAILGLPFTAYCALVAVGVLIAIYKLYRIMKAGRPTFKKGCTPFFCSIRA